MGWSSGGYHFDPVADGLIKHQVADEAVTEILADLIASLQGGDWDCAGESLGEYAKYPAIVEAFRRNGVWFNCNNTVQHEEESQHTPGHFPTRYCYLEWGHEGDHAEKQYSYGGPKLADFKWPQGTGEDGEAWWLESE